VTQLFAVKVNAVVLATAEEGEPLAAAVAVALVREGGVAFLEEVKEVAGFGVKAVAGSFEWLLLRGKRVRSTRQPCESMSCSNCSTNLQSANKGARSAAEPLLAVAAAVLVFWVWRWVDRCQDEDADHEDAAAEDADGVDAAEEHGDEVVVDGEDDGVLDEDEEVCEVSDEFVACRPPPTLAVPPLRFLPLLPPTLTTPPPLLLVAEEEEELEADATGSVTVMLDEEDDEDVADDVDDAADDEVGLRPRAPESSLRG